MEFPMNRVLRLFFKYGLIYVNHERGTTNELRGLVQATIIRVH